MLFETIVATALSGSLTCKPTSIESTITNTILLSGNLIPKAAEIESDLGYQANLIVKKPTIQSTITSQIILSCNLDPKRTKIRSNILFPKESFIDFNSPSPKFSFIGEYTTNDGDIDINVPCPVFSFLGNYTEDNIELSAPCPMFKISNEQIERYIALRNIRGEVR
jgi:hypothetical protein